MSLLPTLDKTKSIFNINMLTYAQRAEYAHHPLAKRLFMLMEQKQTNLIHNPDVDNKKQFIALTDAIGPYICALKTHIDIINDFDWDLIEQLKTLAQKHNFLIIEDRKFCDIGSIVQKQYRDGMYKIVDWADIIIAHAVSGPGVVDGLKSVGKDKNRGMLLLSHLSCAGNLIDNMYTKKTVELAETNTDFVVGLVAQERCTTDIGLLIVAPGISLTQKKIIYLSGIIHLNI